MSEFDLLELRSQGPDGFSYQAVRRSDQLAVECRALKPADPIQRALIARRVQQLQLLHEPHLLPIVEARLIGADPLLALGTPSRQPLLNTGPNPPEARRQLVLALCRSVAACHRLGIAHGELTPDWVSLDLSGQLRVDFTLARTFPVQPWPEFRVPEDHRDGLPDFAADSYALAVWVSRLLLGPIIPEETAAELRDQFREVDVPAGLAAPLARLLVQARTADPFERPGVEEFLTVLQRPADAGTQVQHRVPLIDLREDHTYIGPAQQTAVGMGPPILTGLRSAHRQPDRLGRYLLKEKLGEGGMGAVFRAVDEADGSEVAVKLLSVALASNHEALRRFQKEARMLAEVRHPHVTNLIEINQDQGVHYLVLEFVRGCDLKKALKAAGKLSETAALGVVRQVCLALAEPHARGILHRDIKPANLLLELPNRRQPATPAEWEEALAHSRVKLTDFGLARHQVQSESLALTQTGMFLGSPYYMSPEQCRGTEGVAQPADIYALGITLFELLAGRPPFDANDQVQMISAHCFDPAPDLRKLNPEVTDEVCRIIEKSLAKRPADRYADAAHLLEDIDRLLSGQPGAIELHPRLPDVSQADLFQADFQWELQSSPEELWPYVSNTERINAAVGIPSVEYETRREPGQPIRKFGAFRLAGLAISWEEHPFEWVEGQRLGVLREFSKGPFVWFASMVELQSLPQGGTLLKHSVRIEPRNWLGRMVANLEVNIKGKKQLDKVYRRIDATVRGSLGDSRTTDPFVPPAALNRRQEKILHARLEALQQHPLPPRLVESLVRHIREAPAQELARLRPLALARRWNVNGEDLLTLCLRATQAGLLALHWDILCPTCRIAADVRDTLRDIENHGWCEVCDLDFELDFANSLELFFRVDPAIRPADIATYCIGGPEHFAHVVAQVRLAPGERFELSARLSEGEYRLRGPQLPYAVSIRVDAVRGGTRGRVELSSRFRPQDVPIWKAGQQTLSLQNDFDCPLLLRLERTVTRGDVVSAAQASALPLFRELFPEETLKPGQLLNIARVTLAAAQLRGFAELCSEHGDARGFELLQQFHALAGQTVRDRQGTLIKPEGDRLLLRFETAREAATALEQLHLRLRELPDLPSDSLRAAVHQGPALVTGHHDQLDYFGTTVHQVWSLLELSRGGDCVASETVLAEPGLGDWLRSHRAELLPWSFGRQPPARVQKLQFSAAGPSSGT